MDEAKKLLDSINKEFHELKAAQEAGRKDLEQKITSELADLQSKYDQVCAALNRSTAVTDEKAETFKKESKEFVENLKSIAKKGYAATTGATGGYTVPDSVADAIRDVAFDISSILGEVNNVTTGTKDYTELLNIGGAAASWAGEGDARSETNTDQLHEIEIPAYELYTYPTATTEVLEDSQFDLEAFVRNSSGRAFGKKLNEGIFSGTGSKQMKGILEYTRSTDGDISKVQKSVIDLDGSPAINHATFSSIPYSLALEYRKNAKWYFPRSILTLVMGLVDSEGRPLWQPSLVVGQPSTFLGYPVVEVPEMPDGYGSPVATDIHGMFGDLKQGYTHVTRRGMSVLRDPYTTAGKVKWHISERHGGGLRDSNAFKLLTAA